MYITDSGPITDNLHIFGPGGFRVYLCDAPVAALFEGGITCLGKVYVNAIRTIINPRQPQMLFLSHGHWDHCGAAAYLKEAFPGLKIAASAQTNQIQSRANAVKLISELNRETAAVVAASGEYEVSDLIMQPFEGFRVDLEVRDGDGIELGAGITVEIMATPGHTRDHLCYYMPLQRILMAGEAAGLLYPSGVLNCEFVSDFQQYLDSLQRLAALPVEILCQGHLMVVMGRETVKSFFQRSIQATLNLRDEIYLLLDEEHGSVENTVKRLKSAHYDPMPYPKQPEAAYLINATARVAHLARHRYEA